MLGRTMVTSSNNMLLQSPQTGVEGTATNRVHVAGLLTMLKLATYIEQLLNHVPLPPDRNKAVTYLMRRAMALGFLSKRPWYSSMDWLSKYTLLISWLS